jgi:hypothetical protein
MKSYAKRALMTMLAILLLLPPAFASASVSASVPDVSLLAESDPATPIFHWTFDQVDGANVVNSANSDNRADDAVLKGTAQVITDELRGNVLSLSGGVNGTGWLSLPNHLYSQVNDELTFAVWAYIESSSSGYTRLLSSTITEKGLTNSGISGWQDPEFIFVAGGGTFNNRVYIGARLSSDSCLIDRRLNLIERRIEIGAGQIMIHAFEDAHLQRFG